MVLTNRELAMLALLRLSGRRERGGWDVDGLVKATGLTPGQVELMLATLQQRELVCSALVDGRESMITRQRRLWYLTKSALTPP